MVLNLYTLFQPTYLPAFFVYIGGGRPALGGAALHGNLVMSLWTRAVGCVGRPYGDWDRYLKLCRREAAGWARGRTWSQGSGIAGAGWKACCYRLIAGLMAASGLGDGGDFDFKIIQTHFQIMLCLYIYGGVLNCVCLLHVTACFHWMNTTRWVVSMPPLCFWLRLPPHVCLKISVWPNIQRWVTRVCHPGKWVAQ